MDLDNNLNLDISPPKFQSKFIMMSVCASSKNKKLVPIGYIFLKTCKIYCFSQILQ